jgi:hypothetical protein
MAESWLEMDILQTYLHRNHLNLVQNVNKLREAMKILCWCRASERERTLSLLVNESLSVSLPLPPPPRGTLPAPALCTEKGHPLETVWGHATKLLRKQRTKHEILRKNKRRYTNI